MEENIKNKEISEFSSLISSDLYVELVKKGITTVEDLINQKETALLYESEELSKELHTLIQHITSKPVQLITVNEAKQISISMLTKQFGLSVRLQNCLCTAKISNLFEILNKQESDFVILKNFGKKTLDEIRMLKRNYRLVDDSINGTPLYQAFHLIEEESDNPDFQKLIRCLKSNGLDTIEKILLFPPEKFLALPGIGTKKYNHYISFYSYLTEKYKSLQISDNSFHASESKQKIPEEILLSPVLPFSQYIPTRLKSLLFDNKIDTIQQLLDYSETIVIQKNIGKKTINELNKLIKKIESYDYDIQVIYRRAILHDPLSADLVEIINGSSLEDIMRQIITDLIPEMGFRERNIQILLGRLGFLEGKEWVLQELADRFNITRERVRQIEVKFLYRFTNPDQGENDLITLGIIYKLNPLWKQIEEYVEQCGGVCSPDELSDRLQQLNKLGVRPSIDEIINLVKLNYIFEIRPFDQEYLIYSNSPCVTSCNIDIERVLDGVEVISSNDLLLRLETFCKGNCVQNCSCKHTTSIIKHFLIGSDKYFFEDDKVFNQFAYKTLFETRTTAIEEILRINQRPMHFNEIAEAIIEYKNLSIRNIYSAIGRTKKAILWDRGTYIHRDYVKNPKEIMDKIVSVINNDLCNNSPLVNVQGYFELFKHELSKHGIDTESALFSVLRIYYNSFFDYPEYPVITKKNGIKTHPLVLFENFFINQGGVITSKQITDFATEKLRLTKKIFDACYRNRLPNLLHYSFDTYIHTSFITITEHQLEPIFSIIPTLFDDDQYLSVTKLYHSKKVSCKALGIHDDYYLFDLLRYFFEDNDFCTFDRYPLINHKTTKKTSTNIRTLISDYVLQKEQPFNINEVLDYFVTKKGFKDLTVYNALTANMDILKYAPETFIPKKIIMWDDKKQLITESLAIDYYNLKKQQACYCANLHEFYDLYYSLFPSLQGFLWTYDLLKALLVSSSQIRFLGTFKNIYVATDNEDQIHDLDDLLYIILKNDYDGICNIKRFIDELTNKSILSGKLTNTMITKDLLYLKNDLVMTKESNDLC